MKMLYWCFSLLLMGTICNAAKKTGGATLSGDDIKAAVQTHLSTMKDTWSDMITLKAKHNDEVKTMKLLMTEIHPARQVNDTTFFDCVNFVDVTDPKNVVTYDLDFWFTLKDGKPLLQPSKTEVHKINGARLFDYNEDGTKKPPVG